MKVISNKKYEILVAKVKELNLQLEKLKDKPILVDIRREGRSNKFTFLRGIKTVEIETIGMLADDVDRWKQDLLR